MYCQSLVWTYSYYHIKVRTFDLFRDYYHDVSKNLPLLFIAWLGCVIPHESCDPLILELGFICAHIMSLYKTCRPLFILGLWKYNFDSLTHKGSSFFCYLGQLGMTNWSVIIFGAWHISSFVSLKGVVFNQLSWLCYFLHAHTLVAWPFFDVLMSFLPCQHIYACLTAFSIALAYIMRTFDLFGP